MVKEASTTGTRLSRRALIGGAAGLALGQRREVLGQKTDTVGNDHLNIALNSPEFAEGVKSFHEKTQLYTAILNTGVDLFRREQDLETTRESGSTDPGYISVKDFLHNIPFGYNQIDFFLREHGLVAENSFTNPELFLQWITGEPKRKASEVDFTPKFQADLALPGQKWFMPFGADIVKTMLLKDRERIQVLKLADKNSTYQLIGEVGWKTWILSEKKLPIDEGVLRQFVHETIHGAVPHIGMLLSRDPSLKWTITPESGNAQTIPAFDILWGQTFINNIDFFSKRFDVPGDMTMAWIREEGAIGLRHAIFEFQAMLCADLALPDATQTVMPDAWPQGVKDTVLKTWNFIQNGEDAIVRKGKEVEFMPIEEEAITGVGLPEGEESVRGELHRAREDYNRLFLAEVMKPA